MNSIYYDEIMNTYKKKFSDIPFETVYLNFVCWGTKEKDIDFSEKTEEEIVNLFKEYGEKHGVIN